MNRAVRTRRRDDGHSVVELLTTMVIVSLLLTAFATAVKLMTTATSRASSLALATTQARAATDALSRSLPYATSVNLPTVVGTDQYLEMLSTAVAPGADPTCTQWRVRQSTGTLEMRTWSTVAQVASAWTVVARYTSNVVATRPPFTGYAVDAAFGLPRVAVDIAFTGPSGGTATSQGVYTLRNAGGTAIGTNIVCTEVGRP